jgi:branched-chain amino acid transport system ATP-binding protein
MIGGPDSRRRATSVTGSGAPILVVEEVCKSFGSLAAVDRVSFHIEAGTVFGIAGPNGAGKTTLFNLISGVPWGPDRGVVTFHGQSLAGLPGHRICRRGIARTFQKETAFHTLTVLNNVRIAAAYGRIGDTDRSIEDEADRQLDDFGLAPFRDSIAATLPLFAKKRLMFASAMATRPTLLLLDEPASGLNTLEQSEMEAIIGRLRGAGTTILLIEHVLPLLMAVSDRVMIMNQGRRLVEGAPDAVIADPRVVEAYLGEGWRGTGHAARH